MRCLCGGTASSRPGEARGITFENGVFWTQKVNVARVFSLWALESYSRKLQEFRHPPPLSSCTFGGFQYHVHSYVTAEFPFVPKSPISWTLEFLCKFGSAWNSLVTSVSSSLAFGAYAKVKPLMFVSTAAVAVEGVAGRGPVFCLLMNVK